MRDGEGSAGFSENRVADEELAFAAFVFTHLGCGDGVIELRVGERSLLERCPACAEMAAFGSSESATVTTRGSTLA